MKERVADGACVLGLRFTGDRLVPAARFESLRRELGDGFVSVATSLADGSAEYWCPGNSTASSGTLARVWVRLV